MPSNGDTILVVDDELLNLRVLQAQLSSKGYQVLTVDNGEEALELARQNPSLILLDIMMPGLDGFDTCAKLREDPETRDIPVIFLSAVDDSDTKAKAFEIGGVDYITKPFQSKELFARVRTHLTIRRQENLIREYAQHLESMVKERTQKLEAAEQTLRRDYDLQTVLNTLLRLSLEDLTLQDILDKAMRVILSVTWLSFRPMGCIFLIDKTTCQPRLSLSHNLEDQEIRACAAAVEQHCRMHSEKNDSAELNSPTVIHMNSRPVALCVPLLHRNTLLGTLNLFSKNSELDQRESTLLSSVASTLSGIIRRMQAEEEIIHNALHDSLTELANKPKLVQAVDRILQEGRGAEFALFMLDLDGFKLINESLGHVAGDMVLVKIAERLRGLVSEECTLSRLGGDEFAALGANVDSAEIAMEKAKALMGALAEPFKVDGHDIYVTTSVGVVLCKGYERGVDVIRDADTALHEAKAEGGDNLSLFDSAMRLRARHFMRTANELRKAISNEELVLYLQPLIDLNSGRIIGAEALVRWNHPERGLVPPDQFIPVAEESRLIIGLGSWTLREACRMHMELLGKHGLAPDFMMSVNISGVQFGNPDLVDEIRSVIEEFGMPHGSLKLEITETAVMRKAETAMHTLNALRELGISISIDDFGTGYSSLAYLHKFPIDMLKIDRTFVSRMNDGGENLEIVRTIVTLAHIVNLRVIGEGIEEEEQVELLKSLQCDYGQGYLFSRPQPFEDFVALLKQGEAVITPRATAQRPGM